VTRPNVNETVCEALFASPLQPSDGPTAETVANAIGSTVRRLGPAGCASHMAQEFGDHPETATRRMRWARRLTGDLCARKFAEAQGADAHAGLRFCQLAPVFIATDNLTGPRMATESVKVPPGLSFLTRTIGRCSGSSAACRPELASLPSPCRASCCLACIYRYTCSDWVLTHCLFMDLVSRYRDESGARAHRMHETWIACRAVANPEGRLARGHRGPRHRPSQQGRERRRDFAVVHVGGQLQPRRYL
jgi:hypothetical protein